jgi:hypothetical protein
MSATIRANAARPRYGTDADAAPGQAYRHCLAETTAGASDQHHLAVPFAQTAHLPLP